MKLSIQGIMSFEKNDFFPKALSIFSLKRLFILSILLLSTLSLRATHIVGGSMSYRCLGNNNYEITLTVYRDCFYGDLDAFFDTTASVGIFNSAGQLIDELFIPFNPAINDTLQPMLSDTCLKIASDVCVHTTYYRDTVFLFPSPGGYVLAYQRCCRNGTINNIMNPVSTGATFAVFISGSALNSCNNGATFQDYPPLYICVNEPINFDHSANDIDGDSLVYRLCTPLSGGSLLMGQPSPPSAPPYTPIVWNAPLYSLDNLLGVGDPLTIDPQTGMLSGQPGLTGQFVVGVCVEEYRNGQLLSTTRRDFQYNVGVCVEVMAEIDAPDAQCDKLTVDFQNNTIFVDKFLWDFGDPNNPNDFSMEKNPTYTYSDTGTYLVTLIAEPGTSCADTAYHEIFLQSNSAVADFEVEIIECADSIIVDGIDLSFDSVSPIVQWNWQLFYDSETLDSDEQNSRFTIPRTTEPVVLLLTVMSENGCSQNHSYIFSVNPINPSDLIKDSLCICIGESVGLNPVFVDDYLYQWSPSTGLSDSDIANPVATPQQTTTYTLLVQDSTGGCQIEKTVDIQVKNIQLDFEPVFSCDGLEVEFINTSIDAEAYFWDFGDMNTQSDTSSSVNPSYTFPDTGTYVITLMSLAGRPCPQPDTLEREIHISGPLLDADFSAEYINCLPAGVFLELTDNSSINQGDLVEWQWLVDGADFSNGQNIINFTIPENDTLNVELLVRSDEGCVDSVEMDLPVFLIDDASIQDSLLICPGESVELYPGADPNYSYRWFPTEGLDNSNAPNPIASPETTTTYTVEVLAFGVDTCSLVREVTVVAPPPIGLSAPQEVSTCDTTVSFNAELNISDFEVKWFDEQGDSLANTLMLSVQPNGEEVYLVEATDAFGCQEKDTTTVFGNALNISYEDFSFLCKDDEGQLQVTNLDSTDNLTFSWEPNALILNGGSTGTPTVSAEQFGEQTYFFELENQFGCVDSGAITVAVIDAADQSGFIQAVQCESMTVNFMNSGPNASYYIWNFGDPSNPNATFIGGLPSYTYPDTGTYLVSLILPALDCPDTILLPVEVTDGPLLTADFNVEISDCSIQNAVLSFSDQSVHTQAEIISWDWTFSTGAMSNIPNPSISVTQDDTVGVQLIVESQGGCLDTTFQLLPVDVIESLNLPDTLSVCKGSTVELNPLGDTSYLYNWQPGIFLDDSLEANPSVTVDSFISFQLSVTAVSIDECTIQDTISVDIFPEIDLNTSGDTIICSDSVSIFAISNNAEQWLWIDSGGGVLANESSITIVPDGLEQFFVVATDQNGCTRLDSLEVGGFAVDAEVQETEQIDCEASNSFLTLLNGNLEDTLTVQSTPPGLIFLQNDSLLVNTSVPGTYNAQLTITNQYGCETIDSLDLTVISDDLQLDFEGTVQCDGLSVQFDNQSMNAPAYLWSFGDPANPDSISILESPLYTYSDTGIYQVMLTVGYDLPCVDTINKEIQISDVLLNAELDFFYEDCFKDSVTVVFANESINNQTDTTFINWTLSNGETYDVDKFQLIVTDTITLTATLAISTSLGCTDTVSTTVDIFPIGEVEIPESVIACKGEGAFLNPGGKEGLIYEWSPSVGLDDPSATNPFASPDSTTQYMAVIRSISGDTCEIVREVNVFVPEEIELVLPNDTSICAQSISITATAPQANVWIWTNELQEVLSNSPVLDVAPQGVNEYFVETQDVFGCKKTDSITIAGNALDIEVVGDTFFCTDDNPILSIFNFDSEDTLIVDWVPDFFIEGNNDSLVVLVNTAQTFDTLVNVTIENQYGCQMEDSLNLAILDVGDFSDPVSFAQCEGLAVTFIYDGPNAAYYTWNFGDPLNPGATDQGKNVTYTYSSAGTYTVTLEPAFQNLDCLPSISLDIEVFEPPLFDFAVDWSFIECQDSAILAFTDASTHVQDEIVSWQWTFSNGVMDTTLTPEIILNVSTTLDYELILTTSIGCSDTISDQININLIEVDLTDTLSICPGESVFLNASNPNLTYQYQWFPSDGLDDPTAPNPLASPDQTTTYSVIIMDDSSGDTCEVSGQVTVVVFPELIVEASDDVVLCEEQNVLISATANQAADFIWSDNLDFSNVISLDSNANVITGRPNIYYVQAIDENNCSSTDSVSVGNFIPEVQLQDIFVVCLEDVIDLEVTNLNPEDELSFEWSPITGIVGGNGTSSPTILPEVSLTYYVEISNQFGCVIIDSTIVEVIDLEDDLTIFATPDSVSYEESSQLFVTPNADYVYNWFPGESLSDPTVHNPVASPETTTTYNVEVTTPEGCVLRESITISLIERACAPPFIFVPKAFTPNNDGENDVFFVRGNPIDEMEIIIHNRWGEQVFRSTSEDIGWDGTYRGKILPPDVYGYYLRVICFDGEEYVQQGNVTLLR